MAVFPTGFPDGTPTRTSKVLGDDGTRNAFFDVSELLGLVTFEDMKNALLGGNDVVEQVAATTTSYAVLAGDKNKTKDFLCSAACAVNLPAAMPVGFLFDWIQGGAGVLTFQSVAGAGQTIMEPDNAYRSAKLGARGTLQLIRTNTWLLTGYTQV